MSISIEQMTYTYMEHSPFETTVLKDVNININPGEFIAIIGHTGSGKSTLIQHLNGLIKPSSGDVIVFNKNTKVKKTLVDIRRQVGLVFQYPEYQLFEETVAKDIAFGCKNMGQSNIENSVKKALEIVGLDYEQYKDVSPFELSGGQKRKVAIAGVIAMNPKVLIMDEPTSGLDPQSSLEILNMLKELNSKGICIIMVSHDMDMVYDYATRAIVINDNKVVFDDTPKNVFEHSKELIEMSLDVPSGKSFALYLESMGKEIPKDIMSIQELSEYLLSAIAKRESL